MNATQTARMIWCNLHEFIASAATYTSGKLIDWPYWV